jgi:UPF0755 protein
MKRLVGLLLLVSLVGGGGAAWLYMRVRQPYRGYAGPEQFVDIPAGLGTHAIGERLVEGGVVRDALSYRAALWITGDAKKLKAGEYRFDQPMTPIEAIEKIARGDVYVVAVTFPEGLTAAEMSKIFEAKGFGPASAFIEAARDTSIIRDLDPEARDLEGYLFPDTYALSRHADAPRLVRQMVDRFEHAFSPELREAAEARGLSIRQAVTLASMIEKETAQRDERSLIAAVYENRLRIGMGLQCDPTVIYALQRAGRYDGNLTRDNLAFDSPYNTYRYPGLPPGPIASPGKASLVAAVNPADADYLYFVSRNDGSHEFASSLEEHNRNVQKYQVQYFREHNAGKGAAAAEPPRPAAKPRHARQAKKARRRH